jgi:endogenous inhibitor of DNA gyrase (YacG/DUF329 family)
MFVVNKSQKQQFCSERCKAIASGRSWNEEAGAARVDAGGYWRLYLPDHPNATAQGYVYEHIWVASKKLGRKIERGEHVHHLDENKRNNSPDNLEVLTEQEHHRKHGMWEKIDGVWFKPCGRCRKMLLPTTRYFTSSDGTENRLSSWCKTCQNETRRKDYLKLDVVTDEDHEKED